MGVSLRLSRSRNAVVGGLASNVKGFIFVAAHCVWSEKKEDADIPIQTWVNLSISAYGRPIAKYIIQIQGQEIQGHIEDP